MHSNVKHCVHIWLHYGQNKRQHHWLHFGQYKHHHHWLHDR